ncbi:aquaporin Z [Arsenicicoccus dermatophilus]|uniref:aquaporin Z n=1 Tax=Arsenicicoccus dermatophilus TaxID=1076331 RepID=UPI003916E001
MPRPTLAHRLGAEFLGTFWLVFGGCGSAILAAHVMHKTDPVDMGIGFVGVALAFGLTVLTMAYAVGHVSGGHFNPAVTLGLTAARRFEVKDVLPYVLTQVVAGLVAGGALYAIASGRPGFDAGKGFAANGYGTQSPGGYSMTAVFLCELLCTMFFLYVILGATDDRATTGFAPIAIGLGLTLIHLVSIPVSNTSVNPARSTAVAFFQGGEVVAQQWLFWVAPILGAVVAGVTYAALTGVDRSHLDLAGEAERAAAAATEGATRRV